MVVHHNIHCVRQSTLLEVNAPAIACRFDSDEVAYMQLLEFSLSCLICLPDPRSGFLYDRDSQKRPS